MKVREGFGSNGESASLVPVLSVDQIAGCGQGELRSLQKCHCTFNRMFVKSRRIFNDGNGEPSSLQLPARCTRKGFASPGQFQKVLRYFS
jgi:hypothetical protein